MFVYMDKMIIHHPNNRRSVQLKERPISEAGEERHKLESLCVCVCVGDEKRMVELAGSSSSQVVGMGGR